MFLSNIPKSGCCTGRGRWTVPPNRLSSAVPVDREPTLGQNSTVVGESQACLFSQEELVQGGRLDGEDAWVRGEEAEKEEGQRYMGETQQSHVLTADDEFHRKELF